MTGVLLVLTNPYAYHKALDWAIEQTKETDTALKVVFAIDSDAVAAMVRELGEKGWLGQGPRRSLEASMLEGYRALAADILEEVLSLCTAAGVQVEETDVKEAPLMAYLEALLKQETRTVCLSGSESVSPAIANMSAGLKWIQED
ncbi:MAG: hypothetical protein F6J93_15955 [Oscillatoria sp. SIO1A7]|nr:hypothetical protein [Oscillatoria sp. SIO1A7]